MLKGHVFQNQIFGNQVFAVFANTFLNGQNGVSKNYKNEMNVTYNENSVTVDTGVVCIQGRFLEEDSSTTITDFGSDYVYCKLVIEIDLDKENTELEFNQANYKIIKSPNDYPELTQTNIVENNSGIYQYELARFRTSANGIVDFQDMRTYLDSEIIYGQIKELTAKSNANEANINTNKNNIDKKAPTSHASSGTTYGVGTTDDYGHCKLADNLTTSAFVNGLALSAYQGYLLYEEIKKKINTSGGTISGSIIPNDNTSYDLGSALKKFRYIHAKEFNGTNFYGTNLEMSNGDFLGDLLVRGKLELEGSLYANYGAIQSEHTYNNDNVTNSPNTYITSNGWFRRTTGSSKRYKTDITEKIEDRLNPEALLDLPIKQFKYKEGCISETDVRYGKNILGFIAEDVAEIYEPAVQYDEKGQVEMWNPQVMIPAMLLLDQKHHQEQLKQQEQITELQKGYLEQQEQIKELLNRVEKLEKLVGVENE